MSNSDMYHTLRSDDPISYGEQLCEMRDSGLSQIQIAHKLSTNRQLIGRYQKIGRWPTAVKQFVRVNRRYISNTAILNAATSDKSDDDILGEFQKLVPAPGTEATQHEDGDVRTFPTVPAIREISNRLAAVERQVEQKRIPSVTRYSVQPCSDHSWVDLFETLATPSSLILLICITSLSSYLVYQSIVFFNAIDPNQVSAVTSALVSEGLPILSAACLAISARRRYQIVSSLILVMTIIGLGAFMHVSLAEGMAKQSGHSSRLDSDRKLTLTAIDELTSELKTIPDTFVTKRQEILNTIRQERASLTALNGKLDIAHSERLDVNTILLSYSVWLRVAAMIMNAFLVHLFFVRFRFFPRGDNERAGTDTARL